MKRALIAMSGGVDSSVAAYMMKKEGCECIGATMKLFENEDAGILREKTCCSLDDVEVRAAYAHFWEYRIMYLTLQRISEKK